MPIIGKSRVLVIVSAYWLAMFRRHHNLKRALGLLGVVLALVSSVQQSRLLCSLAGCSPAHACGESGDCEHACSISPTGPTEFDPACARETLSDSCPAESPCPSTCWCHRAPDPFGLPRMASEPLETLEVVAAVLDVGLLAGVQEAQTSVGQPRYIGADVGDTAAERCAVLCRFVI